MPHGITAAIVAECLFNSVSADMVSSARDGGRLFRFELRGRRNDQDALYSYREVLKELLSSTGGCPIIDKRILQEGFEIYAERVGIKGSDSGQESYAVKLLLMQVSRICRNTTTGIRLAPWLSNLVRLVKSHDVPVSSTEEYDSQDAVLVPKAKPKAKILKSPQKRRRLLVRMPTTPSIASSPRCRRTSPAFEEDDENDEEDEQDEENGWNDSQSSKGEVESVQKTPVKTPGKFLFYWSDLGGCPFKPLNVFLSPAGGVKASIPATRHVHPDVFPIKGGGRLV